MPRPPTEVGVIVYTHARGVVMLGSRHPRRRRGWLPAILMGLALLVWNSMGGETTEIGSVEHGSRLYGYYCAPCHGIEGMGTGRNAPYLEELGRAPRDHTDILYMNRLSDDELYRAISEGRRRDGEPPFMPWWGYTLAPEDIWALVAFIRSLARERGE